MSEGTPIRDLPEWPADQPLPADAVAVVGAATAEEAREYLRRLREAEELRLRDLEAIHVKGADSDFVGRTGILLGVAPHHEPAGRDQHHRDAARTLNLARQFGRR